MAKRILALIFARGKRGATCPECGSTNTVSHDDDWRSRCFDCGKVW